MRPRPTEPAEVDQDHPHFVRTYEEHTRRLLDTWGSREGALQAAVGSATSEGFEMMGRIEKALLVYAGLQQEDFLVDVGCGSGRLAVHLVDWLAGPYLGTDVVQTLLDHAYQTCGRSDWRFERVTGLTVPAESGKVDMVCAFSVFTHLRHEESYVYLQDMYRVLRPGGRLVFSFLDFKVLSHWPVFEVNTAAIGQDLVLNQFMSVDAVEAFADHLGLELLEVRAGDEAFIPLEDRPHALGQSVAIARKPFGGS
jgi:SAM-dependent methyltransferase